MKYKYKGKNSTTIFIDTDNFKVSEGDIIEIKLKLTNEECKRLGLEVKK